MNENKEYVSRCDELGNIHSSEEVLSAIAAAAAMEVKGVSGLAAHFGDWLGKKYQTKGVHIKMDESKVEVEVSILMAYGSTIPEVGKNVQENVKAAMESMTGLEITSVNVSVAGVEFPPKQQD